MATELSPQDPYSFSRPDLASVIDIKLNLVCDLTRKIFKGSADLTIQKVKANATEVILDSADLNIISVREAGTENVLNYMISEPIEDFGSKLTIDLPQTEEEPDAYIITIKYETSPKASGIHWVEPENTFGKEFPFVYTHFKPIYARSAIPCQDTPSIKTPFTASISVPKEYTVVMGAPKPQKRRSGGSFIYSFIQPVPVPSYLLAIVIAVMESKPLGPRSVVWAEKEVIERASYEFIDTEKQIKAAEDICGPYLWGTYNIAVMPISFPFRGMENPCLSFISPTILTGDYSLTHVIGYEIAHSWTGNLITCCNFEHIWLNEALSTFIERKILGRMTSLEELDFAAEQGYIELKNNIALYGNSNPLTALVLKLKGVPPMEGLSNIPAEKGYVLLQFLENVSGGPKEFEAFLRTFFHTFKYKSIDSNDFSRFYTANFSNKERADSIDWSGWFMNPGMPPFVPHYDQTIMTVCNGMKDKLLKWNELIDESPIVKKDLQYCTPLQKAQILQNILDTPGNQTISKLQAIEKLFNFDGLDNCEIKYRWLLLCCKTRWREKVPATVEWINSVGRMKFMRSLYKELHNWPEFKELAIDNYRKHSAHMMSVASHAIAKDMGILEPVPEPHDIDD